MAEVAFLLRLGGEPGKPERYGRQDSRRDRDQQIDFFIDIPPPSAIFLELTFIVKIRFRENAKAEHLSCGVSPRTWGFLTPQISLPVPLPARGPV
jgi:hypothetical protein